MAALWLNISCGIGTEHIYQSHGVENKIYEIIITYFSIICYINLILNFYNIFTSYALFICIKTTLEMIYILNKQKLTIDY